MIDPRWGEDSTAPDMLRQLVERLGDMDEDSAEQTLYLSLALPKIGLRNSEDLLGIGLDQLMVAWERIEEGLI